MKFDFCIGNPPYQQEQQSTETETSLKNYAPPVYNYFLDAASDIADIVEMIHPARFLFNAGSTPKAWNEKMLNDEHFKVIEYESDSSKVFSNTDIKGGIAITYRNRNKVFGAIRTFSTNPEINSMLQKVLNHPSFVSIDDIVFPRTSYRLTEQFHNDYPEAYKSLSDGHLYDMASNIFQRIGFAFYDNKPSDNHEYIKVYGREENARVSKYIRKEYINDGKNIDFYKVFIPQASGRGEFGESMGTTVIGKKGEASTETFLSIGKFATEKEAINVDKYLKTKVARALRSVLKVTQIGNKPVYKYIPMQDFSSESDIDWKKPVSDIDQQLYQKYKFSGEEIAFIESHVKEMK